MKFFLINVRVLNLLFLEFIFGVNTISAKLANRLWAWLNYTKVQNL